MPIPRTIPTAPPPLPCIVGAIRSGTTLLRLMLDAHPDLAIPPETSFGEDVFALGEQPGLTPEAFLQVLVDSKKWDDWQLDADDLRGRLARLTDFDLDTGLRAFYRAYADRFDKPRYGDKSPGYLFYMTAFEHALPEARFIHVIRDGRDVVLSQQQAVRGLWSSAPKEIGAQARDWVRRIDSARRQAQALTHYTEVRYETLIRRTIPTLRRLCTFIDLPYHDAMLDYHRSAATRLRELSGRRRKDGSYQDQSERLSIFELTQQPPRADRIGRWRAELAEHDLLRFEQIAAATLQQLDYPPLTTAEERAALALADGAPAGREAAATRLASGDRHQQAGEWAAALREYRLAVLADAGLASAHHRLAGLYLQRGGDDDVQRALACLRQATVAAPQHGGYKQQLGAWLERVGAYREAWRLLAEAGRIGSPSPLPEWRGEPLAGKRLLVRKRMRDIGAEIRHLSLLPSAVAAARPSACTAVVDPRLVPLLRRSFPHITAVARGDDDALQNALRDADVEASYETLAEQLRPDAASFPANPARLRPDPQAVAALRRRYQRAPGALTVGLSWASTNRAKPVPALTDWGALLRAAPVRFVSLQYGDCRQDLDAFKSRFGIGVAADGDIDPLTDLDRFAAQVAAVDLVVSISNTTVHMAGAVGTEVWLLLHPRPPLTWPLTGAGSPWYPRLTIFRPSVTAAGADWAALLAELGVRLRERAGGR